MNQEKKIVIYKPQDFDPKLHYYEKVLNASMHPMVHFFLAQNVESIAARFLHINPKVDKEALMSCLNYKPRFFRWGGGDLFNVTTEFGVRKTVLIETNSSPSGQKSMPLFAEHLEKGGYSTLIAEAFAYAMKSKRLPQGGLAVLYDKNHMEASGYAAEMADHFNENVYLVPFFNNDAESKAYFKDGLLMVKNSNGNDIPIRAAFRYVTQKPWNRIPIHTRTMIFNPVAACLAGGRNKMLASRAYEIFNSEMSAFGLKINTPETLRDVSLEEMNLIAKQFGGHMVIKVPYSNAGQGVYIITSQKDLNNFMELEHDYNRFIVQALIGNYSWSSSGNLGRFYHIGTLPSKKKNIYVSDVRMMIIGTESGFKPIAMYARRARDPLVTELTEDVDSWAMLGTNLSVSQGVNQWSTETSRLLLMDRKDFNLLGIGYDDLVNSFMQTTMGIIAIDKLAISLFNTKKRFRLKLFSSINNDPPLLEEIASAREFGTKYVKN